MPAGGVEGATATYFLYDAAGRLSEKVTEKDSDASVLVRFAYTRDAAGNPIAIEREAAVGAFYYQYDQLQRLSYEGQFIAGDREYENYYEYDAAGNRTLLRHGETGAEDLTYYAYNGANELTQLHDAAGWTYFGYDQNGNTVMEQTPGYTRYFDWDGRDMLTGVRSTEQGWTDNEIRYDGLGSRAELVDSTGTTRYAWDGIRVLKLEDEEGTLKQRQVHGYSAIPSVRDIALMESADGDPYAPIPDQVGTVCKVVGSGATVANSYQYDAFGVSRAVSETFANPFRFAGKPLDPDPTLYDFIARQYDRRLGRFMSPDLLRHLLLSLCVYGYVGNRPGLRVDPKGLTGDIIIEPPKSPGVPGVPFPHIPQEPGEAAAALAKCLGELSIAKVFEALKLDIGLICQDLEGHCRAAAEKSSPYRYWGTMEVHDPYTLKKFGGCLANELTGIPAFGHGEEPKVYGEVWVTWYCIYEGYYQAPCIIFRARGEIEGAFGQEHQSLWSNFMAGVCGGDAYCACCEHRYGAR